MKWPYNLHKGGIFSSSYWRPVTYDLFNNVVSISDCRMEGSIANSKTDATWKKMAVAESGVTKFAQTDWKKNRKYLGFPGRHLKPGLGEINVLAEEHDAGQLSPPETLNKLARLWTRAPGLKSDINLNIVTDSFHFLHRTHSAYDKAQAEFCKNHTKGVLWAKYRDSILQVVQVVITG